MQQNFSPVTWHRLFKLTWKPGACGRLKLSLTGKIWSIVRSRSFFFRCNALPAVGLFRASAAVTSRRAGGNGIDVNWMSRDPNTWSDYTPELTRCYYAIGGPTEPAGSNSPFSDVTDLRGCRAWRAAFRRLSYFSIYNLWKAVEYQTHESAQMDM